MRALVNIITLFPSLNLITANCPIPTEIQGSRTTLHVTCERTFWSADSRITIRAWELTRVVLLNPGEGWWARIYTILGGMQRRDPVMDYMQKHTLCHAATSTAVPHVARRCIRAPGAQFRTSVPNNIPGT